MRISNLFATALRFLATASICSAADYSSSLLPRSSPESQGVSSSAVLAFIEAADKEIDSMHSFMLVRHSRVVAEGWWRPYDARSNHELYSLSKSFTSTAVGLAIAEGRLSLDDPVLSFFQNDAPAEPSANLRAMRVRDLLCMSTGHQDEPSAAAQTVSAKTFLAQEVPHKPGTHFKYNTAATFMLSAIVQKRVGETVLDYLRPRLFWPLGIERPVWDSNWQGISLGGYGLRVRTEDIARFGQLYLQKGEWNGRQLIPAGWVKMATARQTSNGSNPNSDWDQGYGFQFWRCRHGAYRGDGAFGQYCLVLPEQDAVIAITSGLSDMQAPLNLIWEILLPAFHAKPLAVDTDYQKQLGQKLASLALATPDGRPTSPLASKIAGKRFVFEENEQGIEAVTVKSDGAENGIILAVDAFDVESSYPCGFGSWKKSRGSWGRYSDEPVASAGAWTANDTFEAKLCVVETPITVTVTLRFEDDRVVLDSKSNVGFGNTKQPQLVGRSNYSETRR